MKKGFKGRIKVNNDIIMETNSSNEYNNDLRWRNNKGFKRMNLIDGDHTIDIEYCSSFQNKPVKIRRARIKIRRIN